MLSNLVLLLFVLSLVVCVVMKLDVLIAITIGMLLFFVYAISHGKSAKYTLKLMLEGIMKSKNVIIVFMLIGVLTASWRMCGTIGYIIYELVPHINPTYFILYTFLLCSMMSMLIGTSLGSAASMGVICMTIAKSLMLNEVYIGGAILSGIYLGDRTSPMSSSASFVATLTNTHLYTNVKNMIKTAVMPFVLTCIFYFLIGKNVSVSAIELSILSIFSKNYNLSFLLAIPAIVVIVLSLLRLDVKIVMVISTITAMILAFVYQNMSVKDIFMMSIFGYTASDEFLGKLMNGGGLVSMFRASAIIIISSTYFGIFNETPILDPVKAIIKKVEKTTNLFGAMIFTGTLTSSIACNQSLSSMLTYQLTDDMYTDGYEHAIDIENTAILIPTLLPWNIAAAIPMATVGFGSVSCLYAFFAYAVPIYVFVLKIFKKKKNLYK